MPDPVALQKEYYKRTAAEYDLMHVNENDEHSFALACMIGLIDFLHIKSVLDIGSGTGRVPLTLKKVMPTLHVVGIEPCEELRTLGYQKGLLQQQLIDGDAQELRQKNAEFDLVCEFGVLHHVPKPEKAVAEMLRVARKAIFISDSNNFGHGNAVARFLKQGVNALGLWNVADRIKTRGRGYTVSEGDGVSYSYSVFNNYDTIKSACQSVHILNTVGAGTNLYRSASNVALLGLK
jgi:SAM-dependent methyltransferase